MRATTLYIGALLGLAVSSEAQAVRNEPLGEVTVRAPENVYSEECSTALKDADNTGCNWAGDCGIEYATAVAFRVPKGWFRIEVKSGSWGSHGPNCGDLVELEHTWVHVAVPSTDGDYVVGATDLALGDPVYFATRQEEEVFFYLLDIDNLNNGGAVVVSLSQTFADDDNDSHQSANFGGDDCNDNDGQVYPGAPELCDGKDNNCDTTVDEYTDGDGDGSSDCADNDGDGFTEIGGDCNDINPNIFPCAQEIYDGIDNDCDGMVDNPANASGCGCGGAAGSGEVCGTGALFFGASLYWRRRLRRLPAARG